MRQPYLALSLFLAVAILLYSLAIGGHLRFIFFPRVQSEVAVASLTMPPGTPFETTAEAIERNLGESLREREVPMIELSCIRWSRHRYRI